MDLYARPNPSMAESSTNGQPLGLLKLKNAICRPYLMHFSGQSEPVRPSWAAIRLSDGTGLASARLGLDLIG